MNRVNYLPREMDELWHVVVQIRKSDSVFGPDWLSDDDLVDIIELIPVLVAEKQRLKISNLFSFCGHSSTN